MATRRRAAKKGESTRTTTPTWAKGLHARHRRFLEIYVTNGFNATSAYIGAGYKEAGAAAHASRLVRNGKVEAALKLLLNECLMSDAELLARISDEATASMSPFMARRVRDDGELGPVGLDLEAAAEAGKLHHVKKFKVKRTKYGEEISIELVDRQRAQEMLLKVKGLSVDRMELSGPGGAPVSVAQTVDLRVRGLSDSALEELERALEEGEDDGG